MKLFAITTKSESGDDYFYVIKHKNLPTQEELKAFLIEHSRDKSEGTLYEHIVHVEEVSNEKAVTIPKLSKKILNQWETL